MKRKTLRKLNHLKRELAEEVTDEKSLQHDYNALKRIKTAYYNHLKIFKTLSQRLLLNQRTVEQVQDYVDLTDNIIVNVKDFKPMLIKVVAYNDSHPKELDHRYIEDFGSRTLFKEKNLLTWVNQHPFIEWYLGDSDQYGEDMDFPSAFNEDNTQKILGIKDDFLTSIEPIKVDDMKDNLLYTQLELAKQALDDSKLVQKQLKNPIQQIRNSVKNLKD